MPEVKPMSDDWIEKFVEADAKPRPLLVSPSMHAALLKAAEEIGGV